MNPYLIVPVLAFLVNFFTMSYVVALDAGKPLNRSFLLLSASITLWVMTSAAFHFPLDEAIIVPFSKCSSFFWFFTGFWTVNFTYVFLGRRRDSFYFAVLAVSFLSVAVTLATGLVVNGYATYPWGWRFTEGPLFTPVTLGSIVVPVIVSWVMVFRRLRIEGDPVRRKQLTPLLVGISVALAVAAANQFLVPRLPGMEQGVRYTASWSVILSLFVFYTIVRYRFLTPGIGDIAGKLFAYINDGVVILDTRGNVLHRNEAASRMLNMEGDAFGPIRLEERIREYRHDVVYSNRQAVTPDPESPRCLLLNQSTILSGDTRVGSILVITDITEISRMHDTVRESNELFRRIAANVSDVIWLIDIRTGRVTYVSPSVTNILGWTPEELSRLTPEERFEKEGLDSAMAILRDELRHDAGRDPLRTHSLVTRERHRDGSMVDVEINVSFIRDQRGRPVSILGVSRDFTERKRLEDELRASLRELKQRNEMMENDLKTAQMIQRELLPSEPPACDRMMIEFRYLPLEAVGGDYFHIIPLQEGGLSVFLGDVSGHGVPAALFLSLIKSVSSSLLRRHPHDPQAYLKALNGELCENMQHYFLTALYGIFRFDASGGDVRLSIACGGHPPPVLHERVGNVARYLPVRGKLLGVIRDISFESLDVTLRRGDRVYLYTDGVTEITNERMEMLGYERLLAAIGETGGRELGESLDAVMNGIHRFRGANPVDDDIVIIGFEVR
ncbi:MAG: SpoIIE family protein phosphatase [Spirochaetes bacterium]|nr:SpoIIE family protein phosphatase [Spirochaetota bacterium]